MNSGKAIRQKIRDAIKAKLVDLSCYVDDELPDYIMVMLANKRSEDQMTQDLDLFLNNNTIVFTSWLFDLLRKLEQKPPKSEKKKKKKEKSSKHKSQKAEASSSFHQAEGAPQPDVEEAKTADNDVPTEPVELVVPQPTEEPSTPLPPPPAGDGSAPFISISLDTNDVLDKELTEEIDADRKKAKMMAASSQRSPRSKKVTSPNKAKKVTSPGEQVSDRASYREHVIKQRAAKVEPVYPTKPLEERQGPTTGATEPTTTTSAPQRTGVRLRLGERLVQEVIVDPDSRKRKSPGSVLAQVIHHDSEEESDDEGPAKRVASSVHANRRPTLPTSRQANTALLKRAVSEAAASTSNVAEKQAPPPKPVATQLMIRPKIFSAPRPVTRTPQTVVQKMRSPTLANITSSSDHGIQSRSLQREMRERDFDSQAFQTIEDQGDDEDIEDGIRQYRGQEEVMMSPPQKGVFVYKNVVAVMGEAKAQQQQEIIEEVPVISQVEADSRQIYVAGNVSVADSTQSPEHTFEEDDEEGDQEQEYKQQQERTPRSVPQAGGANPRFVVTLEGAKKHLKLSANQRRKNQKRAIKRGFVQQPQQPAEEVFVVKQPRKTISPDVPRKFVFSEVRAPAEEVVEPMDDEGDERTAVFVEEPYMVYPSAQYQSAPYQAPTYPAPKVEPLTISMQDSDDDEGYEAEDAPQDDGNTKSNERCKFWPACKNGDACPFMHPTTPCRTFPRCKFGDKCLYIHPNCRFDSLCTKPNCPYTHATRKSVPPVVLQMTPPPARRPQPPPRQGSLTVCKFLPLCKNPQCSFLHPRVCKFGKSCSRQGCTFFHPAIAVRSSLTWTKTTKDAKTVPIPHKSQRQFAAPSASPALVLKPSPATSKVTKPALSKNPSPGK